MQQKRHSKLCRFCFCRKYLNRLWQNSFCVLQNLTQRKNMDVFDRVMAYNAGREPERLHMKLTAMQTNPFTFLRGTCHLFYEDWHTSLTQIKSPSAWICGDCHLENFGTYKGDNGLVYFDLNDFDECALAPCLWDLTRLLTSLILAA